MKAMKILFILAIAGACDGVPAPEDGDLLIKSPNLGRIFTPDGIQSVELFRNANGALSGSFQLLGFSPAPQDPAQARYRGS